MGLQQFEQRLEQLVEGVFARAFRGGLQPVELGRRLTREMDLERSVGVRGLVAPNDFLITLSARDADRFEPFADALSAELEEAAREHAKSEGYHFMGPVTVGIEADLGLGPGAFRVASAVRAGPPNSFNLVLADGERVAVGDDPVTIGRLPDSTVVLSDPNVSRRHAEVRREGPAIVVVDLHSTNGTKVNGAPVVRRELVDGDEILFGSTALTVEIS
jgi:hypothetical protein